MHTASLCKSILQLPTERIISVFLLSVLCKTLDPQSCGASDSVALNYLKVERFFKRPAPNSCLSTKLGRETAPTKLAGIGKHEYLGFWILAPNWGTVIMKVLLSEEDFAHRIV